MLKRAWLPLVFVLASACLTPAVAGDDDGSSTWFKKGDSRIDLGIQENRDAEAASGPAGNIGSSDIEARLTNVCTGNIGASSTVDGLSLEDRLAVCDNKPEPQGVDAGALARQIRDRLALVTPQLHTSPEAPVKALVGLETWLWVPPGQWRTLTESASLGGTTVTVTARPLQTRWDLGEATKACGNPGRVWRKGLGQHAQTPCGYTYKHTSVHEPGDKYKISAVLRYRITWTCEGDCSMPGGDLGTLDSNPDTAALEVSERQSVVING